MDKCSDISAIKSSEASSGRENLCESESEDMCTYLPEKERGR